MHCLRCKTIEVKGFLYCQSCLVEWQRLNLGMFFNSVVKNESIEVKEPIKEIELQTPVIDPSELETITVNLQSLPWLPLSGTNGFPNEPAIYFAIDSTNTVQYVGKAVKLRGRWKRHHKYAQLKQIGDIRIHYLYVKQIKHIDRIEALLIQRLKPLLNNAFPNPRNIEPYNLTVEISPI
jgi:hypothetical protein